MKDFDWRLRYAPHGYYFEKQRITFETLHYARFPQDVLALEIERMRERILQRYDFDNHEAFTRITIWPKQTGEELNHLDPLVPRFGIEIEIRVPMRRPQRQREPGARYLGTTLNGIQYQP